MTALLAKEAREIAGLVILCSAACALVGVVVASHNHDPIFPLDLAAVAVSAALLAAGRFAAEVSEGTLLFLVSLPQTRLRTWTAKAVVGLAGALVVTTVLIVTIACRQFLDPAGRLCFLVAYPSDFGTLLTGSALAYFATLLCSAFLESSALSVAAGLTLAFSGCVGVVLVAPLATVNDRVSEATMGALGFALLATLFATGSAAVFSLRETLHRQRIR